MKIVIAGAKRRSWRRGVGAILAAAAVAILPTAGRAQEPVPPGVSGFPPGYFLPCAEAPKTAVLGLPAPFDRFMRVLCTRAGHALAPLPGYHWVFANGMSLWLSAMSPKMTVTGQAAYFTRLAVAPLTAVEAADFRRRLKGFVRDPSYLAGELLRLEVDTSTGEHRQEYIFARAAAGGALTPVWGIECLVDCRPLEKEPWAFEWVAD